MDEEGREDAMNRECVNCVFCENRECKRYPKTVCVLEDGEIVSNYPDVHPHDWCGEFLPEDIDRMIGEGVEPLDLEREKEYN